MHEKIKIPRKLNQLKANMEAETVLMAFFTINLPFLNTVKAQAP